MQVATISADLQVRRESYKPDAQCHARVRAYLYECGISLRRGRECLRETMAIVLDDLATRLSTRPKKNAETTVGAISKVTIQFLDQITGSCSDCL